MMTRFLMNFSGGFAVVMQDHKYGFINEHGEEVTALTYDEAKPFREGLAAVYRENEGWGFIDESGNEVIPLRYHEADSFSEGLALVEDNDSNAAYINKTGQEVISLGHAIATPFSDGVAFVNFYTKATDNQRCGYIDKKGNMVFHTSPDFHPKNLGINPPNPIETISEGIVEVSKDLNSTEIGGVKWGFMDKTGNMVIPAIYDATKPFHEGLAPVYIEEKGWGYIDKEGNEVIPFDPNRTYATVFSDGLALEANYYEGQRYIDKTGKPVYNSYGWSSLFYDGVAFVDLITETEDGIITMNGYISNPIRSSVNPNAVPLNEGVFGNLKGKEYTHLEDSQGEILVKFDEHLIKCNKYYMKGIEYDINGELDKAKQNYEKALLEQPKNIYIMKAIMQICKEQNNTDEYKKYEERYNSTIEAEKQKDLQYGVVIPQ